MFTFPAFDSNFKSRKRTFRCCDQCRVTRKKCEITSDFLLKGCVPCELHHRKCSLVTNSPEPQPGNDNISISGFYSPLSTRQSFEGPREATQLPRSSEPYPGQDEGTEYPNFPSGTERPRTISPIRSIPKLADENPLYERMSGYSHELDSETFSFDQLKKLFNFSVPNPFGNVGREFGLRSDAKVLLQDELLAQHANGKLLGLASNGHAMVNRGLRHQEPPLKACLDFLRQIHAFTISSPSFHFEHTELKRLYEVYFFKINNILPIAHEKKFWELYELGNHCTLVALAIILLVLKDNLAKPILRKVFWRSQHMLNSISSPFEMFSETQYMKALKLFQRDTETKIRQLLLIFDLFPEITKLSKLTVNLLLSCSCGFGKFGGDKSSSDLDKALTLALSMHLHIKKSHRDTYEDADFAEETRDFCCLLFWCCWLLDRFCAMVNHRLMMIKKEDFNLDPPYKHMNLLRLVEVAKSFENMCIYVYQPGYPQRMAEFTKAGIPAPKIFDLVEFETSEFEFCDNEIANSSWTYTPLLSPNDFKRSTPTYVSNNIHFLTRIINNATISIAQELKFRDPKIDNDEARLCMFKASSNILWYFKKLDDDFKLNLPIIPFVLKLALGCALTRYANVKVAPAIHHSMVRFEFQDFFQELKKYRELWTTVDELCCLLEDHFETQVNKKKHNFDRSRCENSKVIDGECFNNTTLTQGESAASIRNIIHLNEDKHTGEESIGLNFNNLGSSEDLYKLVENDLFFSRIFKSYGDMC